MLRGLIALMALSLFAAPAAAQDALRIEIIDYGTYETSHAGRSAAPDTVSGTINHLTNIRHLATTQRVFGRLGNHFGFRFRIVGDAPPDARLTMRTIHPPISDPRTGRRGTVGSFTSRIVDLRPTGFRGYGFDHRWELAEGDWTLQVLYRGQVLAEKTFRVVIPLN